MTQVPMQEPETKKKLSYTYWVTDNNKSRELPPEHRPQKVQQPINNTVSAQGASAWNACGTWEQKKILMSDIQNNVKSSVQNFLENPEWEGFEIEKVEVEGQAYKVYKKNKWHLIYEIHGSIEFKKQDHKAKIKIVELTSHNDREYEVSGKSQLKKVLSPNADAIIKLVQKVLAQFQN